MGSGTRNALKPASARAGNIMLEFAIGAGLLVAVFGGTFEFGFQFLEYNNLQNAVVRGARYAALRGYDSDTVTPSLSFQTAVQNMVVYGSPAAGSSPAVAGLTTANVNLGVTFTNGVPGAMTVSITSFAIPAVFGDVTLTNKPRVTWPYQGVWAPL